MNRKTRFHLHIKKFIPHDTTHTNTMLVESNLISFVKKCLLSRGMPSAFRIVEMFYPTQNTKLLVFQNE